jgi:hypothetical protein
MYKLFLPFWKEQLTVRRVDDYSRYHAITPPTVAALAGRLPSSYVAVRFYFSSSFPDTAENRAFVESTVRSLAATTDVVLLNTGIRVDDHQDYSPGRESRIHTIDDLMTPERNLDIQTAVIAKAQAFVGTYGGYSYLAPLCGVPAIAFYSERDAFYAVHREIAERMIRDVNGGSLVTLDVKDGRARSCGARRCAGPACLIRWFVAHCAAPESDAEIARLRCSPRRCASSPTYSASRECS